MMPFNLSVKIIIIILLVLCMFHSVKKSSLLLFIFYTWKFVPPHHLFPLVFYAVVQIKQSIQHMYVMGFGAEYLFHAELPLLQGLTETHLPQEEAPLVYQCWGLEAWTHWKTLGQVGMETDGDVVSETKRKTSSYCVMVA